MDQKELDALFSRVVDGKVCLNVSSNVAFQIAKFQGEPDFPRYIWTRVKCRICEVEFLTVYPCNIFDDTILECESCGHCTCEPMSADFCRLDFDG